MAVLVAVGSWASLASAGYEHGKADATNALWPHGVVILGKDGRCAVYDQPGLTIEWHGLPARAQTVILVYPPP